MTEGELSKPPVLRQAQGGLVSTYFTDATLASLKGGSVPGPAILLLHTGSTDDDWIWAGLPSDPPFMTVDTAAFT